MSKEGGHGSGEEKDLVDHDHGDAHSLAVPVADEGDRAGHLTRTPKPRPEPLAFPDEKADKKPPSSLPGKQYGTFAAPPAIAAEGQGVGSVNDGDASSGEDGATGPYRATGKPRDVDDSADMGLWEYLTSPQSPLVKIRDHCQHQWVAILLTLLLLGLIIFFVFGAAAPQRPKGCNSDFGVYLGEHNHVAAYSNCKYAYSGDGLDHYVTIGLQRVYSGSKWHALEYARRYWILTRLLTFPSLPFPDMLLNVTDAYVVTTTTATTATSHSTVYGTGGRSLKKGQNLPMQHFTNLPAPLLRSAATTDPAALAVNPNGVPLNDFVLDRSAALPQEGDLVLYARHRRSLANGHVAVVVGVQGPYRTLDDVGHRILDSPSVGTGGKKSYATVATSGSGSPNQPTPLSPDRLVMDEAGQWRYSGKDIASEKDGETQIAKNIIRATSPSRKADADATGDGKDGGKKETEEEHALAHANAFAYHTREDEADGVFYRVYLAEQNWNNGPWVDLVRGGKTEQKVHRGFSRVILLKEYYPSHTFYLEDNSGQRVLGWVRPPLPRK